MSITWEEPPASGKAGASTTKWAKVVEELKANAGEWACVAPNAGNNALQHYLQKRYGLEATARANGDGTHRIYARWVNGTQP